MFRRRSEEVLGVLDIFWTSFVRSTYAMCLRGKSKKFIEHDIINYVFFVLDSINTKFIKLSHNVNKKTLDKSMG